uniref:Unconventional myosin-Ic n=1 Tax=Anthurium amnicola TaxID=1678845 RepID=A0A1D1YU19_9ARAE
MTTDNTKNTNNKTTCLTPKLLLKPTSNKPNTATTSMIFPSAQIATGVFILPIKQKNHRKGGSRHTPKHLRKPPSFDSYLISSANPNTTAHYMTRTPSLSSSYSSTSSFVDNVSEYTNEEMIYGYGSSKSINPHRHHRRLSSAYKVRFAETSDDGSSIVSSSSSVDEWDDLETEEEEDYILVARQSPPHHYFDFHKKNST